VLDVFFWYNWDKWPKCLSEKKAGYKCCLAIIRNLSVVRTLIVFDDLRAMTGICWPGRVRCIRKGRRKRDGGTYINDSDDIIGAMLTKMKEAADADREANQSRKPALHKLKMFPSVVSHLKKQVCAYTRKG